MTCSLTWRQASWLIIAAVRFRVRTRKRHNAGIAFRKFGASCNIAEPMEHPGDPSPDSPTPVVGPISLTIFFPAYNEEENLIGAVEDAVRAAEGSSYIADYEILIVDDGSTDRTRALAESAARRYPAVRVVAH